MKISAGELKKVFGSLFLVEQNDNEAVLKEKIDLRLFHSNGLHKTPEEAIKAAKDKAQELYLYQVEQTKKYKAERNSPSNLLLGALGKYSKVDEYIKKKEEEAKKHVSQLDNIHTEPFNADEIYEVKGYEDRFLKVGEKLFLVVEQFNSLDIGIYEVEVSEVSYFERNPGNVDMSGKIKNLDDGNETPIRGTPTGFESAMMGYKIFTKPEEALKFFKENVLKKFDAIQERAKAIEKKYMP